MKPQILGTGTVIDLKCNKPYIAEFPALHFGDHSDGSRYFDATDYLQLNPDRKCTVEGFFTNFQFQINILAESYSLPPEKLVVINAEGHQLISGVLSYLWLLFVEPSFNAYIFERIDDLFTNGIAMSDSYLADQVTQRFPPKLIRQLADDEEATA